MKEIRIHVKSVSGKKSIIAERTMSFDENIKTVRGLIEAAVAVCVKEYSDRREASSLNEVLIPGIIESKAKLGKVSFGANYGRGEPEIQAAVENAAEAFSDGIIAIFADKKRFESLDEIIDIETIGSLTFVKLTMLAGRMW